MFACVCRVPIGHSTDPFKAYTPGALPVECERGESPTRVAQEPNRADILAHERVLKTGCSVED